eukprot:jgi/Chlat1/5995/Chrsp4S06191
MSFRPVVQGAQQWAGQDAAAVAQQQAAMAVAAQEAAVVSSSVQRSGEVPAVVYRAAPTTEEAGAFTAASGSPGSSGVWVGAGDEEESMSEGMSEPDRAFAEDEQLASAMSVSNWLLTIRRRRKGVHSKPISTVAGGNERTIERSDVKNSPETVQQIAQACSRVAVFQMLQEQDRKTVYECMQRLEYNDGDDIVQQGEEGKNFYVIHEGSAVVSLDSEEAQFGEDGAGPKVVNTLGPGDSFGELALLHSCPRSATVTGRGPVTVWGIDRQSFQDLLRHAAFERRREYIQFLDNVPLLSALTPYQRQTLADALVPVEYQAGTVILSQGVTNENTKFHIIANGTCTVSLKGSAETFKRLRRGQYFGEIALLEECSPTATVAAYTDVKALTLDRDAFVRLLGHVEHILHGNMKTYTFDKPPASVIPQEVHKPGTTVAPAVGKPPAAATPKPRRFSQFDFIIYKEIGQGFTGSVYICKLRNTDKTCVLKVMKKAEVIRMGEVEHILSERRALSQLSHPFLVEMLGSFQDLDSLYIAMEHVGGGELFEYMAKKERLSVSAARFYACEVLLALEYIHSAGYVYRDLKPENVLISDTGHVKVVDMGFAKKIDDNTRCYTFCGTPDYLCPEVLQNTGHGKPVDFWAFGVLLFEMLAGYAPFTDSKLMVTYQNILFVKLAFPPGFDPAAQDLIAKLLVVDTTRRLGCMAGGVEDIKRHPFFADVNWQAVADRQLFPPYIPPPQTLTNMKPITLPSDGPILGKAEQLMFADF